MCVIWLDACVLQCSYVCAVCLVVERQVCVAASLIFLCLGMFHTECCTMLVLWRHMHMTFGVRAVCAFAKLIDQ